MDALRLEQIHIDVVRNATDDFNPFHDPNRWQNIQENPFGGPIALGFQLVGLALDRIVQHREAQGERQLAARARFDGAMAQAGSGLKDVLWHVVCSCESLSHAEKGLGWPARSGKLVLRLALDRVADFYRIR